MRRQSISRTLAAVPGALLVAGCGAAAKPMGVAEVVPEIRALNGKTVRVAGYLGECAGYECRLFVDEAGLHDYERAFAKMMSTRDAVRRPAYLGIGVGEKFDFDARARPFTNSYVVITGKITDACRTPDNAPGCMDRSTDLKPTDIQPWSPTKSK